jgi:hypothetical protein
MQLLLLLVTQTLGRSSALTQQQQQGQQQGKMSGRQQMVCSLWMQQETAGAGVEVGVNQAAAAQA